MDQSHDVKETLPLANRLLARFGEGGLQSWSVDKGFSAQADRELLELFLLEVIMPKNGRHSQADQARETQKTFRRLQWDRIGPQCLGTPWVESLSRQRVDGGLALRRVWDLDVQSPQDRSPAVDTRPPPPATIPVSRLAPPVAGKNLPTGGDLSHKSTATFREGLSPRTWHEGSTKKDVCKDLRKNNFMFSVLARRDRVVPFGSRIMPIDRQGPHLPVCDLEACFVVSVYERGGYLEPSAGRGCADVIEHGLVTVEWPTSPVL